MMNEEMNELMQREIDGANAAHDSARLQAYLAEHPEAMSAFDELRQLAKLMSEAGRVEPPSQMHKVILNRIEAEVLSQKRNISPTFTINPLSILEGVMKKNVLYGGVALVLVIVA